MKTPKTKRFTPSVGQNFIWTSTCSPGQSVPELGIISNTTGRGCGFLRLYKGKNLSGWGGEGRETSQSSHDRLKRVTKSLPRKSEKFHLFDWFRLFGHFPVTGHMSVITHLHLFNLAEKVAKDLHTLNNTKIYNIYTASVCGRVDLEVFL